MKKLYDPFYYVYLLLRFVFVVLRENIYKHFKKEVIDKVRVMRRNSLETKKIKEIMVIGIDFDGTCVDHKYPYIGKDIPHCIETLKMLVEKGNQLILYTMRSHKEKEPNALQSTLDDAVMWFQQNNIPLYGVNNNPTQHQWTISPKVYCNLYIDDAALGIPLMFEVGYTRPFVNWLEVQKLLKKKNIL